MRTSPGVKWAIPILLLAACGGGSSGKCDATANKCEGSAFTYCDNGTLRNITCKGPNGCIGLKCDTSTHTLGDGCAGNVAVCDAVNTLAMLQCVAGTLKAFRTCSGPRQCYPEGATLGCDVTIGDTCPATYNNRYACDSVDSQQVVVCSDGGFGLYSKCSGTKNCASGDAGLTCQ